MKLKTAIYTAVFMATMSISASAAGTHAGGHGEMMAVGKPGDPAAADRVIEIVMRETASGEMIFEPAAIAVKKGETIRFAVRNEGELEHEFVLDEHSNLMKHKDAMMKAPEMEHDDPNAIRLDPGRHGEVVWTFANGGDFVFGCLIPGHYEAGMKGAVSVASR